MRAASRGSNLQANEAARQTLELRLTMTAPEQIKAIPRQAFRERSCIPYVYAITQRRLKRVRRHITGDPKSQCSKVVALYFPPPQYAYSHAEVARILSISCLSARSTVAWLAGGVPRCPRSCCKKCATRPKDDGVCTCGEKMASEPFTLPNWRVQSV